MKKLTIILCILLSMGIASAAATNYLGASKSDVSPSGTAKVGLPVIATMTLERVGSVPEEAILRIVTDLDSPRTEITIDGDTQECGLQECEITLPSEGVEQIKIRTNGDAPKVEKQLDIIVLNVNTTVQYRGEDLAEQKEGTITLTVSDKEIRTTKVAIENAEDKLAKASSMVNALESQGVNTVEFKAEIQDAKELITTANDLHDRKEIDLSKSTADSASKILDRVITKAEKAGTGPAPSDMRRYLVIAGAVIVVLVLVFILKSRREELG